MKRGPLYESQTDAGAVFLEVDGWTLPTYFRSPDSELEVIKQTVGLSDLAGQGLLQLRGRDRLDFVHRLSTNDLLKLSPGQGAPTVFTTPIGRIVDLAFVLVREDDLLLVVGRGADEAVAAWLRRHIFFNDDVTVSNLTEQLAPMGFRGPASAALTAELFGTELADLAPYGTWPGAIVGMQTTVVRSVPLGNDFLFLTQANHGSVLWETLAEAAAAVGGSPVGEAALETGRVAEGWPRYGREMTEDYIPLEAGLKWAISFNKGCYVGQEVIARMEARQRLAKRLVVLGFADASVAVGDKVRAGDARVGHVTSVAPLVDRGTVTALAYVKAEMAQPGRELEIFSDGGAVAVKVLVVPGSG